MAGRKRPAKKTAKKEAEKKSREEQESRFVSRYETRSRDPDDQEAQPPVTYPGREHSDTDPVLLDAIGEPQGSLAGATDFQHVLTGIFENVDYTSIEIRDDESPPSAAIHAKLDGKRYVIVLQPTDLVDRAVHQRRK